MDMETKEESERQVMAREEVPSVAAIQFVIEIADHDSNRVYKFSEACAEGLRYQHHVLKMPANPDSWFSLYELRKVGWPDPALHIDMSVREYRFTTPEEAVLFIERAFKACGYEARHRDNFNDVVYLNLERMTTDMAFMLSLLAAEHEWETSILHYKTDRKQYANPKYFVVADDVHTPQVKAKAAARSLVSLPAEDVEMGAIKWRGKAFADNLTNPARYWFKQLPPEVKSNWKEALNAFHKKYCTDYAPARLTYYRLTQKSDELATNYLYRLNAAAMKAGIAFRDGSMSSDLEEHIQQFFETLHDKTLQMQFRFTPFDSIDDLEKKLIQYETAQIRPAKKQQARRQFEDVPEPTVNKIDSSSRAEETKPVTMFEDQTQFYGVSEAPMKAHGKAVVKVKLGTTVVYEMEFWVADFEAHAFVILGEKPIPLLTYEQLKSPRYRDTYAPVEKI
ncbi:hypothetical protein P43SY_006021 [Pythium insidiosum]|uniref:Retrotransposon gag domain-containing protein n=1 Tax=Pythium insidiosum TaxID=114742 RepID=A0AAD5LB20_PYTIN|nr:hypothetical protein P43SY_006021 [Pythium insidiosum]